MTEDKDLEIKEIETMQKPILSNEEIKELEKEQFELQKIINFKRMCETTMIDITPKGPKLRKWR